MTPRILAAGLAVCLLAAAAAGAAPAKKKAAKKSYDYEKSKYKAYKVFVNDDSSYRFNSKGEPVRSSSDKAKSSGEKKAAGPAKAPAKRAEFPKADEPAPPKACEGESCPAPEQKPTE